MSNNYNTTLQSNNTDLQAILSTINELPEAGGDPVLQDKTVTPTTSKQTITADSGYDGLDTVTINAMPTATQARPSITVSSAGLITASSTQGAGYVTSGTTSSTKQLTVQAAQTITPGTSNKTIASGIYLTGTQTIEGDSNLVADNIKNGVSIFGVTGTHSGGGNVETCTVTISAGVNSGNIHFIYADENGKCVDNQYYVFYNGDLIVNKGIFVIAGNFMQPDLNYIQTTGGVEYVEPINGGIITCIVFDVTGDGSIQIG